jgi:hypothetical protein
MTNLVYTLILSIMALAAPQPAIQQCPSSVEYQVFSVVLDSLHSGSVRNSYMVFDSTLASIPFGSSEIYDANLQQMDRLPPGLAQHFRQQNTRSCKLDASSFGASAPVHLVDAAERSGIREATEDDLPPSLPAGELVTFSRAGFTADGDHALVHTLYVCGGRCGGGKMIYLVRSHDAWMIRSVTKTMAF